jgi:nucleotide-binding universal stress UspA family protein
MTSDREYIEAMADALEQQGYQAEAILAGGDPAKEIAACAEREKCDLIAMATHGHRGLSDVIHGSVASQLRHISMVPVLMVRGAAHLHPAPAGPRPAQ